mgnify:CR=1 FL=1
MFNRLTWAKNMAEYLADNGLEVILLDNNSRYAPLLDWYKTCPFKIHRFSENLGHKVLWTSGIINEYPDEYYATTDHDLDLTGLPDDFVEKLFQGLENEWAIKSGLSLRVDDLPRNAYTKEVTKWESKWWLTERDTNGFYFSDVDTTFALYDAERTRNIANENEFFRAVRAPKPYECTHLPWHDTTENITPEEQFYMDNIGAKSGYWTHHFKRMQQANQWK